MRAIRRWLPRALRRGYILTLLLLGLAVGGGVGYYGHYRARAVEAARLLALRQAAWQRMEQALRARIQQFPGESGVVVEDLRTGWRFAHRAQERFAAASLIKVPIMSACFQASTEGRLDLDEAIVLAAADRVGGSGVLKAAAASSRYTISQLIELMVTRSDNTAANLLIGRLGYDYLNASFAKQGLRQTRLVRKMMDFSQRSRGVDNFTSAEDNAAALRAYYRGEVVNAKRSAQGMAWLAQQQIRDRIPSRLPREVVVAHKTGLERHVVHDVGIILMPQGDMLVCVLTRMSARSKAGSRPAKAFIGHIARHAYDYAAQLPGQASRADK